MLDWDPRFRILQAIHPDWNVLTDMYGRNEGVMRGQTENRIMRSEICIQTLLRARFALNLLPTPLVYAIKALKGLWVIVIVFM